MYGQNIGGLIGIIISLYLISKDNKEAEILG
jgi:hypothetical protein